MSKYIDRDELLKRMLVEGDTIPRFGMLCEEDI